MSDCNDPNHYDPTDEIARATAALRARVAELERERDEVHAALDEETQLKRYERQAKLDAMRERDEARREVEGMRERARAAEAQRDEAVSLAHESLAEAVSARADAARLREALEQLLREHESPCSFHDCRCGTDSSNVRQARAALASAPSAEPFVNHKRPDGRTCAYMADGVCTKCGWVNPSAKPAPRSMTDCMMTHHPSQPCTSCDARRRADKGEPTPRDMRVACHAWTHGFVKGREYEALDTLEAIQRVGEFTLGEGIDLAAVVAKAVEP